MLSLRMPDFNSLVSLQNLLIYVSAFYSFSHNPYTNVGVCYTHLSVLTQYRSVVTLLNKSACSTIGLSL